MKNERSLGIHRSVASFGCHEWNIKLLQMVILLTLLLLLCFEDINDL
jgi:hypothetical protein